MEKSLSKWRRLEKWSILRHLNQKKLYLFEGLFFNPEAIWSILRHFDHKAHTLLLKLHIKGAGTERRQYWVRLKARVCWFLQGCPPIIIQQLEESTSSILFSQWHYVCFKYIGTYCWKVLEPSLTIVGYRHFMFSSKILPKVRYFYSINSQRHRLLYNNVFLYGLCDNRMKCVCCLLLCTTSTTWLYPIIHVFSA